MELPAQWRLAGRAVSARRAPGRQGQRRHAGRLRHRRAWPDEVEGRVPRRRGVRLVRSRDRAARRLHGPGGSAVLRPAVRWPQAQDPRLQPAAHSRQLEADAREHQGPVPPGAAAQLVRHVRPLACRQQIGAEDGRQTPPRRDDLDTRRVGPGRAGDPGVELQGRHEAARCALSRHRPRALVGRAERRDDHAVPERNLAATGEQRVDAPHPARRRGRVQVRVDALRLRRRRRGDDAAAPAPGQLVRPGGFCVGRRRRSDRVLADRIREQTVPPRARRTRRARRGRHRSHGDRNADPRHVPLLARGDGGARPRASVPSCPLSRQRERAGVRAAP